MDNSRRLFSKLSIALFSAFGTTFFGALLYTQNLKDTNNERFVFKTIIFSIVYTVLVYKLAVLTAIPFYYIFYPCHLIGGLIIIGPLWKAQIGIVDTFQKRQIWGPLAVLAIPVLLIIFLNIFSASRKLTTKEFQEATKLEGEQQLKRKVFVSRDSALRFYDIQIPLLPTSFTFSTHVEDVNTLYNYIDYKEGRFSVVCMRIPLANNDKFDFSILGTQFASTLAAKECANKQFRDILCADYNRKTNDTTSVIGSITMIKEDRIIYQYITQSTSLDKSKVDSLSDYLITKITPARTN